MNLAAGSSSSPAPAVFFSSSAALLSDIGVNSRDVCEPYMACSRSSLFCTIAQCSDGLASPCFLHVNDTSVRMAAYRWMTSSTFENSSDDDLSALRRVATL